MRTILQKLSRYHELIIVMVIGFGWFTYVSTSLFFQYQDNPSAYLSKFTYSGLSYAFLLIYELLALLIIVVFLHYRNWGVEDFNLKVSLKVIGAGILLLLLSNVVTNLIMEISFINSELIESGSSLNYNLKSDYSPLIFILSAVIINPFFEEFLLIGYLGKWFESSKPIYFIALSTLIRLSYHTYQGYVGIISVVVIGLVFSMYYLRNRKLVPVIFAHMLFNLLFFLREYLMD